MESERSTEGTTAHCDRPARAVPQEADSAAIRLAADHPDAVPGRTFNTLRTAVHAIALIAILGFIAYYCLWTPMRLRNGTSMPAAVASPEPAVAAEQSR